jgi:hypothetical protein
MRPVVAAAALVLAASSASAAGKGKYDWDALGAEFCRLTVAGDLQGLRPLITDSLARAIEAAAANPALLPPQVLFQTYTNEVPVCEARTSNAALVEVRRSKPGGAPPAWTEYLVIVPEADGSSRIDDVLFATRRSDTLRARLAYFAATR